MLQLIHVVCLQLLPCLNLNIQDLVYDYTDVRPDSEGPSVISTESQVTSTPDDLLPTSLEGSFAISVHFKRDSANG